MERITPKRSMIRSNVRCVGVRLHIKCLLVTLVMLATYASAYGNVKFEKVWLEHGVSKNGVKGMVVHTHFSIEGMKGKEADACAWIKDEDGEYVKDKSGHTLGVLRGLDVTYENSVWKDLTFFIPYDDMVLKDGKHSYFAFISVHSGGRSLAISDDVEFTGTGSGDDSKKPNNRQMLANGGYRDRVENADGSITSTTVTKCTICHGTGKCSLCGGQGGLWGGYGQYRSYHICKSCGGGAVCKYCNGTGDNVLVSTYYPATNESYGYDLHTGNMVSSVRGYNSNSHNGGSSNKQGSCSYCNGTGIDSFAWGEGSIHKPRVGGYTHSSGGKCPYCGKYEWHQHVYCPHCQADKY